MTKFNGACHLQKNEIDFAFCFCIEEEKHLLTFSAIGVSSFLFIMLNKVINAVFPYTVCCPTVA